MGELVLSWMRFTYIYLLVGLTLSASACGSVTPEIRLLGMADGQRRSDVPDEQAVRVFLEVVNPGTKAFSVARMTYQLRADGWLGGVGEVALSRSVPAQSSTIIEVPLALAPSALIPTRSSGTSGIAYTLEARIYTGGARLARSWRVHTRGHLAQARVAGALRAPVASIRVAERSAPR